jgi:hypothetical protein
MVQSLPFTATKWNLVGLACFSKEKLLKNEHRNAQGMQGKTGKLVSPS